MTVLTAVLPCYHQADRLPATLACFLAELSPVPGEVGLLVVDDGSTDATAAIYGPGEVEGGPTTVPRA
jgi:glycosyltransferase involved in cell wall biosynthesis